eukprot:266890-Alexandrium_andersonii.AAC.1
MVAEKVSAIEIERGSEFDRLDLKHFTNPDRPHQEFPVCHHLKAAHIRGLVGRVAKVLGEFVGPSRKERVLLRMVEALAALYVLVHNGEMFFSSDDQQAFFKHGSEFLQTYAWLNRDAKKTDTK